MSNAENALTLARVRLSYDAGRTWAVDGVDLSITRGQRICLVGPNGSGKSTLARIMSGLAAPDEGVVTLLGLTVRDHDGVHPERYRRARRSIGAVFQNPEDQIVTTVVADDVAFGPENLAMPRSVMGTRVDSALAAVGLSGHEASDPTRMSGGQQQRVAIAGTLSMGPDMIVFDEPTAMLDVDSRRSVLRILDSLQKRGTTIIHVTHHHDETRHADRVIRMEHGRIVSDSPPGEDDRNAAGDTSDVGDVGDVGEAGEAGDVGCAPKTRIHSCSCGGRSCGGTQAKDVQAKDAGHGAGTPDTRTSDAGTSDTGTHDDEPLVFARHLCLRYRDTGRVVLHDVDLDVHAGERVAVTGPNGSGKTTLARLICGFGRAASSGTLMVTGHDMTRKRSRRSRSLRRDVGFVMQHPERQLFADTVRDDVAYGPRNQGLPPAEVADRVDEALAMMGVSSLADRSPFALSGGQQRLVAIAGIIACRPRVLVLDEPTAGLDRIAVARVENLLDMMSENGVAVILITHERSQIRKASRVVTLPGNEGATGGSGRNPSHNRPAPLERMDPRVKLLSALPLMFTAFSITNPMQLALTTVLTALLVTLSGVPARRLGRSIRAFLVLFAVTGLLNVLVIRTGTTLLAWGPLVVTDEGLRTAVLYSCRFALVIVIGALVLLTTTPTRITDAVGSLLSPWKRLGIHTDALALVLSLALRFLPTLGEETRSIIDAQSARGGDVGSGSPGRRIRALVAITIPVFAGTLRHADNLSLALDARCYEADGKRTHWRAMSIGAMDVVAIIVSVLYVIALIVLGVAF